MSLHKHDVRQRLERFLGRKQMPRRFEGKPVAMEDEIRALAAATTRHAPRSAERLAEWWPSFEARLGEVCGAMWPTEREIRDAAQAGAKDIPRPLVPSREDEVAGPAQIIARQMAQGVPVGEGWIWGIGAVELAARGLVDAETMRAYRSAAFLTRRALYGDPAARAWEDERRDAHEAAKAVWKARDERRKPREAGIPNLRSGHGVAAE